MNSAGAVVGAFRHIFLSGRCHVPRGGAAAVRLARTPAAGRPGRPRAEATGDYCPRGLVICCVCVHALYFADSCIHDYMPIGKQRCLTTVCQLLQVSCLTLCAATSVCAAACGPRRRHRAGGALQRVARYAAKRAGGVSLSMCMCGSVVLFITAAKPRVGGPATLRPASTCVNCHQLRC